MQDIRSFLADGHNISYNYLADRLWTKTPEKEFDPYNREPSPPNLIDRFASMIGGGLREDYNRVSKRFGDIAEGLENGYDYIAKKYEDMTREPVDYRSTPRSYRQDKSYSEYDDYNHPAPYIRPTDRNKTTHFAPMYGKSYSEYDELNHPGPYVRPSMMQQGLSFLKNTASSLYKAGSNPDVIAAVTNPTNLGIAAGVMGAGYLANKAYNWYKGGKGKKEDARKNALESQEEQRKELLEDSYKKAVEERRIREGKIRRKERTHQLIESAVERASNAAAKKAVRRYASRSRSRGPSKGPSKHRSRSRSRASILKVRALNRKYPSTYRRR